jgi:hypothetical protein
VKVGNLVASGVFAVWGAGIVVYAAVSGGTTRGTTTAYQTGQVFGLAFGLAMLVLGVRGVRNQLRQRAR